MKVTRTRGRIAAALTAPAVAVLAAQLAAVPAAAAAINDPPVAPHSIIVFPARDFVSASGYARGDRATVQVLRGGTLVGSAPDLVPQDDVTTPGFDGLVEVNHPGGGCWVGVTPDIRAGDIIRVLTAPDTGDQTPTANVTVTQPATMVDASTVVIKGTAVAAGGGQIPVDQLEARIVANKQAFVINGKRTIRAGVAAREGTLTYDGPGLTTWTATFTGLDQVSAVDGLSDAQRASSPANSESRGMWLGRAPGALLESTIFEYGVAAGPAAPCTAPLATGPSVPDLAAASDTGASSTDNITNNATPVFTGATGLAAATNVNLYVDGVLNGSAPVGAGGTYSVTAAAALTNGSHTITASEFAAGAPETMSAGSLAVVLDTVAPAPPAVTGTVPATTGSTTAPAVKGTAEAGSTVSIFLDAACSPPGASTGAAADFAAGGIATAVAAGSTSTFFASATDVAGNASGCSTGSAGYVQDSVAPPAPTIGAASMSGVVASTSAVISFSDTEAGATFQCALDGGVPAACTSPANLTGLGQGTHTFAAQAVDAARNSSAAATATWTVDTVGPTVSLSSPAGSVLNTSSPTFQFTASEAGSTVVCALDGAPAAACTTATSQTSSGLADGPHTFAATATDKVGNTGPAMGYAFTVDTAVPAVHIDTAPPSPSRNNTPGFTFSSPKAGVNLTCAFALAANATPTFSACQSGSFTPGAAVADGAYRFTVKATDAAGNVGSATGSVTVDTAAPAAPVITSGPPATTTSKTVSFGFTSAEPGVSFLCTMTPGSLAAPCSSGESYGPLAVGSYTFKVQAKDQAGNIGSPTNAAFTVASAPPPPAGGTAPVVSARAPGGGATAASQTANITATFSANVTGISGTSFTLKNAAGATVPAVVSYNPLTRLATLNPNATLAADTRFTAALTSAVKNAAGTSLTAVSWTFTTGPRPAVSTKTPATNAVGVSRTANITATLSETATGVSSTTFRLTSAVTGAAVAAAVSYNPLTRVATLNPTATLAANTKYTATLTGSIKDAAGNPLTTTTWSFTTGP